jgi:alkaline phosphatase
MKKLVLIFALILAVAYFVSINKNHLKVEYISIGTQPTKALEIASFDAAAKPKNIILIIGDGTGLNQITLSRIATGGADHRLAIDQMPFFGNSLTHSYNNIYTDSAASATSWATGVKTKNKFLSITPDGKAIPTIPEILSNKGYISGLVATSSITHATPAAFYAHIDSRYKEKEIASQLLESPIQLSLGGGLEFFDIAKAQESNLLITDMKELDGDDFLKAKKVLGLFDEDGINRSSNKPTQLQMTKSALDFLSLKASSNSCNGFFLMSEGSQIDWASHDNDAATMVVEFKDFDQTIAMAMDFVTSNKETLLLVTADHETGGLQILSQKDDMVKVQWGTGSHTSIPVGVYAYGPGAHEFTGLMDNTDIHYMILDAIGTRNLEPLVCSN